MVEVIAVENGRISNFQGLMTLTLDRVILHTVVITHRPLPTCEMLSFIEIKKKFWTDGHLRPTLLG